jgi:imidazolonepropionase
VKANKLLIKNAAELVTCRGGGPKKGKEMNCIGIIENGAVVIENGLIGDVGTTAEVMARVDDSKIQVIDATGKCVMPGFVDSHTHMVFGGYRAQEFFWRMEGVPYLSVLEQGGGILSTVQATRASSAAELAALTGRRMDEMLSMGVTTVEGKSGYGLDLSTELRQLQVMSSLNREHPLDIVATFLGAHAVPPEYMGRTGEYVNFIVKEVLPQVAEQRLAEFCDVFCEQGVFSLEQSRHILETAAGFGLKGKLHADEIIALGGAELAAELRACSADHLLKVSAAGIAALAKGQTVATLLPVTAFSLQEGYAKARDLIDAGAAVALATDYNPGSCFSHSIPLTAALAAIQMKMTPAEIVTALTINGAAAVNRAEKVGSLEIGKQADVVILEYPSHLFLIYHVGMNIVEKVIKNGNLVWDKAIW